MVEQGEVDGFRIRQGEVGASFTEQKAHNNSCAWL